MTDTAAPDKGAATIDDADLSLIDDRLEDDASSDEDIWDDLEAADSGASDDDGQDSGDADLPDDEDNGDAGDGEADKGEGRAAGDKPAADPKAAKSTGGATDGEEDPLWASASAEHREAYRTEADQWKLKDRRYRGQISSLQQQLNDANARLKAPARSDDRPGDKKASPGASSDQLSSEEWKAFKEEYPELSAPMEALIGNQNKVISDLQSRAETMQRELAAIGTERRTAALGEQEALLKSEHADWQEVAAEVAFGDWVQSQPRHIREAAIRNANDIVDAAEAADLISRYKQQRTNPTPPADPVRQASPEKAQLSGKRRRQLETAASARTRGPGSPAGIPEDGDPGAIWDAFEAMEARNAGR